MACELRRDSRAAVPIFAFVCVLMWVPGSLTQEGRILAPPSSVNATLNSAVIFQCNGTGILLTWLIDNVGDDNPVVEQRGIVSTETRDMQADTINRTLTVPATMENNNLMIECIASGFPTNDLANATLKVQGLLDPPPALEIILTETNILNLTWMAPFTLDITDVDPDIIDYRICHNLTSCGTGSLHFPSAGCSNSSSGCFNLSDARASTSGATNYLLPSLCDPVEFYVSAWNGAGLGRASNVTFVPGNVHRPTRIESLTEEVYFEGGQLAIELVIEEDGNCVDVFEVVFYSNSSEPVSFQSMIPELTEEGVPVLVFSDGIIADQSYTVSVMVADSFMESTSLTTFDVQEADVTPGKDSITVTCYFARGSIALGCVILVISGEAGDDNITFYLYRDNTTGMLAPNASRSFSSILSGIYQIIVFDIAEDNTTDMMKPAVEEVAILPFPSSSPIPLPSPTVTLTTTTTRDFLEPTVILADTEEQQQNEFGLGIGIGVAVGVTGVLVVELLIVVIVVIVLTIGKRHEASLRAASVNAPLEMKHNIAYELTQPHPSDRPRGRAVPQYENVT